jgi:hypothetical protein
MLPGLALLNLHNPAWLAVDDDVMTLLQGTKLSRFCTQVMENP